MNWFGKKAASAPSAPHPSTVSATTSSVSKRPSDPQSTIVNLRQNIENQEKRCVFTIAKEEEEERRRRGGRAARKERRERRASAAPARSRFRVRKTAFELSCFYY